MSKFSLKNTGPGALIADAFICTRTVTLCTLAGVKFGFHLLWAMLLSILATIVLQEMAARLGVISKTGAVAGFKSKVKGMLQLLASVIVPL